MARIGVFVARDQTELLVARSVLDAAGIPSYVVSDSVNRLFGLMDLPLGFDDGPDPLAVLVDAENEEAARGLLEPMARRGGRLPKGAVGEDRLDMGDEASDRLPPADAPERILILLDRDHSVALLPTEPGRGATAPSEASTATHSTVDGPKLPTGDLPLRLMNRFRFVASYDDPDDGSGWDFFFSKKTGTALPAAGLSWTPLECAIGAIGAPGGAALRRAYVGAFLGGDDPAPGQPSFSVVAFGATRRDADELGRLVAAGRKTGTASLLWSYESEGIEPPESGSIQVVIDGSGAPLCLLRTASVEQRPFDRVDAEHAAAEGEGDLSLDYWRRVHWKFFSAECADIGRKPERSMPIVLERFELLRRYPAGDLGIQ